MGNHIAVCIKRNRWSVLAPIAIRRLTNIAVISPGSVIDLTVVGIGVIYPLPIYQYKCRRRRDINKVTYEGCRAIDEYRNIAGIELELLNKMRRIIRVAAHVVLRDTHTRHLQAKR